MNINYNHMHSFQPNTTASLSLREELTATEIAIREKKPGTIVSTEASSSLRIGIDGTLYNEEGVISSRQGEEVIDPSLRAQSSQPRSRLKKLRMARIPGYTLAVYLNDIPDPPPITYAIDLKEIINDWISLNCKATLVINGTRIPLVHWIFVYRYNRSKVWNEIKSKWRTWRVSYPNIFIISVYL